MSFSRSLISLLAVLCLSAPAARADTIATFSLTGDAPSDLGVGNPTGTVTIDTTIGSIVAVNFATTNVAGLFPQPGYVDTIFPGLYQFGNALCFNSNCSGGFIEIDVVVPEISLVGYDGGPICSNAFPCANGDSSDVFVGIHNFALLDGQLSPTPELSSFILLGTGLLALVGAGRVWSRTVISR